MTPPRFALPLSQHGNSTKGNRTVRANLGRRFNMLRLISWITFMSLGCVIHNIADAFPAGFVDGLAKTLRGEGDLTDICGVLFIPCIVTFVLTRRTWLKWTIGVVWFVDLFIDSAYWFHHLVGTGMVVLLVKLFLWLNKRFRSKDIGLRT